MVGAIQRITGVDNGARFYKIDLHFHTPASHDYEDRGAPFSVLVERALQEGLHMVAVTDHNIALGYDKMREAARGTELIVLPGVELTVGGGKNIIHILGVFPEKETSADIVYLLHNLRIKDEDMGKKQTITSVDLSIPDILKEVDAAGGIAIAAHTDSAGGLTEEIRGVWRTALVQHDALKVVEIVNDKNAKYFDGQDRYYRRKLSCIKGSDAHHPDHIGRRATWVKMGECSFAGLRQIVFEPDLRISLTEPRMEPYPKIIGMDVSGGLYQDEVFHFNRNLNCLIGGRGAGKSAVIDFIRFALDYPPRSEDYLREFKERMAKLVGMGNHVRVYVENEEGLFVVQRNLTDVDVERISGKTERVAEIHSEAKIYQVIDDQLVESSRALKDILEIEVFGQGEVFELTRRADNQLKLIDEYIGADRLFLQETELLRKLEENASDIVEANGQLASLERELTGLKDLKGEIENLEKQLRAEVFKKHGLWQAEETYLRQVYKHLEKEAQKIEGVIEETVCPELPEIKDNWPNVEKMKKVDQLFRGLFESLEGARRNELQTLATTLEKITDIHDSWKSTFDQEESRFRAKLVELGVSSHQALSNRLAELREKEFRLEKTVMPRHKKVSDAIESLTETRKELLSALEDARKEIHTTRAQVVDQMSRELEKGDAKIEVNYAANRRQFFELLDGIYTGSDIYRRKEHLGRICESTTPSELVRLISNGDTQKIEETFHVTAETAKKIVDVPKLRDLFRIEVCPLNDELVIYLKKAAGEEFSPLKDLSYGEKCTAIFSIALLGKEKPLLVDQPEDELDHAFIIKNIVGNIRTVKEKRQLIISTHNANIPVLGDAELIFKVVKVPGALRCRIEERGAFEKATIIERLQDLEGGSEAFRRRREKYGI